MSISTTAVMQDAPSLLFYEPTRHRVQLHREALGITSVCKLAEITKLSVATLYSIENRPRYGTHYRTNRYVAEILADTFDCTVEDLFYEYELSDLGRPPLTGKPLNMHESLGPICDDCRYVLALNGTCHCD